MKLSKRGEYALRALIDLGIAQELGRPLLRVSELVEKERLPAKFLVQILLQLREAGFVESKRGKLGGYLLARPMDNINFGQIVRLIDGPLAPIACCSQTAYDVRNAIADVLDRYTLADIVGITRRKLRNDHTNFHFGELLGGFLGTAGDKSSSADGYGDGEPMLSRPTRRSRTSKLV